MSEKNCSGLAGLICGHEFEDVIEEEYGTPAFVPNEATLEGKRTSELELVRDMIVQSCPMKSKYVHSICRRCGLTTSRESK